MEYSFGDECKGRQVNLGLHKPGRYYDVVSSDDLYIVDDDLTYYCASCAGIC